MNTTARLAFFANAGRSSGRFSGGGDVSKETGIETTVGLALRRPLDSPQRWVAVLRLAAVKRRFAALPRRQRQ